MDWKREGLPLINIILGGIGALILGSYPVIILMVLLIVVPFITLLFIAYSISYHVFPISLYPIGDFIISILASFFNVIVMTFLLSFSGGTMMANSFLRMAGYSKKWLLGTSAISLTASAIVLFIFNPIIQVIKGPFVGMDNLFFFIMIGYLVFQSLFLLLYLLISPSKKESQNSSQQLIDGKRRSATMSN